MKLKTRHLAIIAITVLIAICLIRGINSAMLGSALGLLAGLGGYEAYQAKKEK